MPKPSATTIDPDVASIDQKMRELNDAYRTFKKRTIAIAKKQRMLLARLQELIDSQARAQLAAALRK